MADRILEIVDLLLGAAYADRVYQPAEEVTVRRLLGELLGEDLLPADVEARLQEFRTEAFELAKTAAAFKDDPAAEKRKLLELVVSVRDADDEIDLDEDEYVKALAAAIDVPTSAFADLVLHVEVEDLRSYVASLRKPPPTPNSK